MRGDKRLRVPTDHKSGKDTLNQIGERLESQRQKLNLRQDKLIARIDDVTGGRWRPTRQDLYKISTGARSVSEIELLALAVAVECDPVWLFVGEKTAAERAKELAEAWKASPVSSAVKTTEPDDRR